MSHGPGESRYVEEKRHFEKPIPISDLVLLDRERCILCDRCTRFADEVAGDKLIHFTHRGNETQVLTFPDEPFASYFSGNTVQICPVGALTAKPYRFKARPWDLEQVESTCTTCSVGCRIGRAVEPRRARALPGRRLRPGQLGLAVRPGPVRLRGGQLRSSGSAPRSCRGEGGLAETTWNAALDVAAQLLADALEVRRAAAGSRSSAAPAAPTRTPTCGRASPTRSASSTATPSSATGCRPSCSTCPGRRSTRRRRRPRSCCSGPTSRRSCRSSTSGCATPPRSGAAASSSSHRPRPGSPGTPGAASASRPGRGAGLAAALADAEVREQLAAGPSSSSPGGPTSPSRRRRRCRAADGARRLPGRQGAAGAAPRQRRRRAPARAAPRQPDGARRARHPRGGRGGAHRAARPARCRSALRLSPTPTSPAGRSPAPAG